MTFASLSYSVLFGIEQEADGHEAEPLLLGIKVDRHPSVLALLDRAILHVEHLWQRWPAQVQVQDAHSVALGVERKRELCAHGRLADAALARQYDEKLLANAGFFWCLHFVFVTLFSLSLFLLYAVELGWLVGWLVSRI